jgi:hypothetical protein
MVHLESLARVGFPLMAPLVALTNLVKMKRDVA